MKMNTWQRIKFSQHFYSWDFWESRLFFAHGNHCSNIQLVSEVIWGILLLSCHRT